MQAYTTYAFFEWALILLDVGFDAVTALDFQDFEVVVREVQGSSRGYVYWLPKYANVGRWLCFPTGIGLTAWAISKDFRISDDVLEKEYVYHQPL